MDNTKFSTPSRLIILGNGFDLKAGLKSRFSDYVDKYLYETTKSATINAYDKFERIDTIHLSGENLIYFQIDDDTFSTKLDYLINPIMDVNYSFWDYLLLVNQNDHSNWKNVENEILKFLKENVNNVWTILQDIKKLQPLRLNKDTKYCIFLSCLIMKMTEGSLLVDKAEIYDLYNFLFQELLKFEANFKKYLSQAVSNNSEYISEARSLISSLLNGKRGNILSFNYTLTYDYTDTNSIDVVRNVHGDLSKDIIIGIDQRAEEDANQNVDGNIVTEHKNNENIYLFSKTYRIMRLASERQEKHILNKSIKSIVVYGHSLAAADYSYFQSIFDFYSIYDSDVTLVFYYSVYKENDRKTITKTQFDSIRKLLIEYGTTLDNKDHGKNLLHKLLLEDRLIIKELNH